ncbi:MAG TPA: type II toxin-antitoxin system HipA family toxin [Solirubrobacterales bacterium]|jgi:serine/threonine-protein kinase HipA|nr:type II toxin-antitoxin system HipA family toxin [Solirubrobacterales bacterium]
MTSEPAQAFVWVWLPGATDPVVAGRLDSEGEVLTFTYGRSYLEREDRIALYLPELPLGRGPIPPPVGEVAGCIADAAPDAWGRRVILNRRTGWVDAETTDLGELDYLLESGSDRIGALDFQTSPSEYVPRSTDRATLRELAESAERVEQGIPLSPALDRALLHGSSVGGARPKALLGDDSRKLIAKFSSTTDNYSVVKGEFMAMELARRAGIDAAPVELTSALGRDALLVERFDRPAAGGRRAMVSALTMLRLDEWSARDASYADLADLVRSRFSDPGPTLRELFARIVFNILTGNSDDHARNHAAFWDGAMLTLTPAYDICPSPRAGGETAQLMAIGRDGFRMSQVAGCVERASVYLLSEADARQIVDHQIEVIENQWAEVCDLATLTEVERGYFWHRQFLNPYATEGY